MAQTLGKTVEHTRNAVSRDCISIFSIQYTVLKLVFVAMSQLPLEVVLAMEVSGTRTAVNEWLGMVQRVREVIVCEKVHDALVVVKALEDGMTEYLDEDKDKDQHYFNRPATSSNEAHNETNAGHEHTESAESGEDSERIEGVRGDEDHERIEGDEDHEHNEGNEGDECNDRPRKRQRQ